MRTLFPNKPFERQLLIQKDGMEGELVEVVMGVGLGAVSGPQD